ncbi:SWI5-dependent HO expression protein 4 [Coemansia sp. RSA 2618]|nr:SWI5-dependent HO expression protein 4 [Coemansia sp. RSA 2618]
MLAFAGDSNGGGEPAKRLLKLLGQSRTDATEARSLAMLVASQLAAAARDPESSARFPNYDVASVSRTTAPSTPPALAQLRTTTASTLDARVQSTIQSERAQGLLALAALYESGAGSELATTLWAKSGWAEDLWDQGEFDKRETQLALLCLADACSTDAKVSAVMKRLGNGLVQALARKRSDQEDLELADVASAVLAKWSGLPTAAAAAPRDANTEEVSAPDTDDADPMQLADTHIERITALAGQDITDTGVCAAAERSTEALGFLCLRPELKERVAQNSALLQTLFAAALKSDATALKFATVMLIRNLTQYRPVLSEEQKKMQRLQQLNRRAAAGEGAGSAQTVGETLQGEQGEKENKLDAPELVAQRAALVCNAGAAKCLVSAVQSRASDSMKDAVAEIAVSLATAPRLRGLLVQQGLVRALLSIATSDAPRAPASKDEQYAPRALVQARDKHVALALAKIAISVPPHLAFRDPRGVVRLVLSLLAEESDAQALLMRFEALLALTNLASVEPGSADDVRGYMACDLGGMSLIEMCVLSDHVMVRRASTELMCNLVYDPRVFERFVGDADKYVAAVEEAGELLPSGIVELASDDEGDAGDKDDGYRAQRMHLLVALADVDDAATRSAAAGALAVLSNDARCCRYLVLAHPRALAVLLDLADDSDEDTSMRTALRHRAAVVCANAAGCGDTRVVAKMCAHEGLVRVLREMTGDSQMPYYTAAKSALELLGL